MTSYQGPKLTFLGRRQLATEMFFSVATLKNVKQRNKNQNFWSPDGKFWSPMFLLRIRTVFPLKNNITYKHTYHSTTQKNHDECRPYTEFRATSNGFKSFLHLLDVHTHYKQTEAFQYTNFYSCHPPGEKKAFIKGEALRLLRKNSSHLTFNKNMQSFKTRLKNRGVPK